MTAFDQATNVKKLAGDERRGVYAATLHRDYVNISGLVFGGYLLAIILRAFQEQVGKDAEPLTLQAQFLAASRISAGVEVHVNVIKKGKRLTFLTGEMLQNGKPTITATAVFTNKSSLENFDSGLKPHFSIPPPDIPASTHDCLDQDELIAAAGDVPVPPFMKRTLKMWIGPNLFEPTQSGGEGAYGREATSPAVWTAFRDKRPYDALALCFISDAIDDYHFRTAVVQMERSSNTILQYATATFMLHFFKPVSPAGPRSHLALGQSRAYIEGGTMHLSTYIWDGEGRLVAKADQGGVFQKLGKSITRKTGENKGSSSQRSEGSDNEEEEEGSSYTKAKL
ncbi:hypothetical protein HK102_000518 [Quaeritorhiza haematococci]|nr:hypothetical protein HK102_000518 [Quaeritorhiza haematococci]